MIIILENKKCAAQINSMEYKDLLLVLWAKMYVTNFEIFIHMYTCGPLQIDDLTNGTTVASVMGKMIRGSTYRFDPAKRF